MYNIFYLWVHCALLTCDYLFCFNFYYLITKFSIDFDLCHLLQDMPSFFLLNQKYCKQLGTNYINKTFIQTSGLLQLLTT